MSGKKRLPVEIKYNILIQKGYYKYNDLLFKSKRHKRQFNFDSILLSLFSSFSITSYKRTSKITLKCNCCKGQVGLILFMISLAPTIMSFSSIVMLRCSSHTLIAILWNDKSSLLNYYFNNRVQIT